ncbi:Arc family DNA-binding protein [Microbulbifer litoralis]|uniref:Arc family DNA-binding protein n=1 Tax=Microbulbifer litoralis TaxID=2933965 RepID=UPI0020279518|nr:Arc family DNA-binding protein [Microbulbifer sp. GX H0434]
MAKKKAFPLRINEQVLVAMQRWADDDLRSVNAQIEYVLRDALVKSGRVKLVQKVVTEIEEKDGNPEETQADK